VEDAGEEALAGAGLAEDEDGRQAPRALGLTPEEALDLLAQRRDARALPEELAEWSHDLGTS
jgi:hypothetical protein